MSTTREPPCSIEDEERLLSCIFIDGADSFSRAVNAGAGEATFYSHANQIVWSVMASVAAEGKIIAPDVVASALHARGLIERIGGYSHLVQITKATPTTANLDGYIRRLRNLEVLRGVMRETTALVEECFALRDEDPATVIDPRISKLLSISSGLGAAQDSTWDEVVTRAEANLEEIIRDGGVPKHLAIHWPWARMDQLFAPMQRGQLIVLGARPSIGKSSLARPIALFAASHGHPTYFVTLEVSPERVPLQLASSMAKIGLRQVNRAHVRDQDDMRKALRDLHGLGITISKRDRSIARICGRARALKAQGKLDLLVIDHGLLLDDVSGERGGEMASSISRVTKALKKLAGDLDIAVLLLWQLNRNSANDDNREPDLPDLKNSGSLEEDADKVIFIHRPTTNPMTGVAQSPTHTVEQCPTFFQNVIQAKGRDDGTSFMSFSFDRATARFTEIQKT